MKSEELINKYPSVGDLPEHEKKMLLAMMEAFEDAPIWTMAGGEELLKMCDGCAFKKGTEANGKPTTVLTALECVFKEQPFYCHKRFNSEGNEKICNGWINIMNNK